MTYPESIRRLINELSHWPSVGPKTAERFALYLLRRPQTELNDLARGIANLKQGLTVCKTCCRLAESSPCALCNDSRRDQSRLCLVAESKDLIAIENSGHYQGLYHVLGGVISAIHNTRPGEYNLQALLSRLSSGQIKEVILALNPDLEGESTCLYLMRLLKDRPLTISRLARGLPTGASLDYADEQTIGHALANRQNFRK